MTTNGNKHLLIIGPTDHKALRAAERRDLKVVLMTAPHALSGTDLPDIVAHAEELEPRGLDQLVPKIHEIHRQFPLAGITSVFEFVLEPAAAAAAELGLPTNPPAAVRNTRDKILMRQVLAAAGLGQVRFAACRSVAQAERFFDEVGAPIFVKPANGTASHGVSRVDRRDQLPGALELVKACLAGNDALCEEFVPGPEISLEAYSVDGRFVPVAFTDKRINEYFAEIGHQQPSTQAEETLRAAADLTARALASLGVISGVTHTELKLTPQGPVLVETHTRVAGDNIHLLTEHTTGVDLVDVMTGIAVGEVPDALPHSTGVAAAIRWLRGGPGQVTSIDLPAIDPERGLVDVGTKVVVGQRVSHRSHGPSGSQLAYLVATDATPAAAAARADRLTEEIRIEFQQGPGHS